MATTLGKGLIFPAFSSIPGAVVQRLEHLIHSDQKKTSDQSRPTVTRQKRRKNGCSGLKWMIFSAAAPSFDSASADLLLLDTSQALRITLSN